MKRQLTKINLIAMIAIVAFVCIGSAAFAQDSAATAETITTVAEEVNQGPNVGETILSILGAILGAVVTLGIIGHMLYVRFMLNPRYKQTFDASYFSQQRNVAGLDSQSTPDENTQAIGLLEHITDDWETIIDPDTGDEEYFPTKIKHIRNAVAAIDAAIAIAPTDPDVLEVLNNYVEVVNINEKRHFSGSKPVIWIALGFGVLMAIMGAGWTPLASMFIGAAIYYIASSRPAFLIAKEKDGKVGFLNSILVGALAMIGMAQTVRTTTTFTDGSKEVDDDNSQHWFAWILALVVMIFLACTITVWSFFNYLRNYVLYI